MVASLRYSDAFVKRGGSWLFSERQLYVDCWLALYQCASASLESIVKGDRRTLRAR